MNFHEKNALVNEQQIENTRDSAQSRGNKNNKNITDEQQRTKITNENKNKDNDNDNKVSTITEVLNLVINRLNTLEKLIRPPSKISVKE